MCVAVINSSARADRHCTKEFLMFQYIVKFKICVFPSIEIKKSINSVDIA